MVAQSIPQDLIDKLDRRAHEQRKMADRLRKLAAFDEEIRDALVRFYAAGGIAEPGGQSDDRKESHERA